MNHNLTPVISTVSLVVIFFGASLLPIDAGAKKHIHANSHTSSRNTTRTNVNRNVHVNKNVNVHTNRHVDIDVHNHYHPIATAAAVTATAVVTSAIVGSIVYSVPPSCSSVYVGNVAYKQCGTTWYQPQYAGSSVQYIVVNPPR